MRIVEIKYISPESLFRLIGGVGILVGVGLCIYLSTMNKLTVPAGMSNLPFLAGLGNTTRSVFTGGIIGVIYGAAAGLSAAIVAILYNFFSGLFGGVDITLDER